MSNRNDNWQTMYQQGLKLLELFAQQDHHAASEPVVVPNISVQRSAGANASRLRMVWPSNTLCAILTTPVSPHNALSSSSSRPSSSGSYLKSRKNQFSFHRALTLQ